MEAGLRTRRIQEVDRTWRLYRGLYEVVEVTFLRDGSHGGAECRFFPSSSGNPQPQPKQSLRSNLRMNPRTSRALSLRLESDSRLL